MANYSIWLKVTLENNKSTKWNKKKVKITFDNKNWKKKSEVNPTYSSATNYDLQVHLCFMRYVLHLIWLLSGLKAHNLNDMGSIFLNYLVSRHNVYAK